MTRIIQIIVIFIIVILFFFLFSRVTNFSNEENLQTLKIGKTSLKVEIMDTAQEREQGLSGREKLTEKQGMLFIFEQPGNYGFWMKEMNFPIDIIWISKDKRIVGFEKNIPAPEKGSIANLPIYNPPEAILYVLEVNAGWVDERGIKTGDLVSF